MLTTHLRKLGTQPSLKWGSVNFAEHNFKSSKFPIWITRLCHISQNPRFYGRKRTIATENIDEKSSLDIKNSSKISNETWAQAQTALLEYLHSTRSLQFMDAENISRNSPQFLTKLLERVETSDPNNNIKHSITRLLRYHPINEFEPFFESLGLDQSDYVSFLPRDLMFLSDDKLLLENYHVLCNYGISHNKIGKIYKEAKEIFRYDYGVLISKIRACEKLGFDQNILKKIILSSPTILTGNVNSDSVEVIEKFKNMGFDCVWIESHMLEDDTYDWRQMLELFHFFNKIGFHEDNLFKLIHENPGLIFEDSGKTTLSFIGLFVKFGSSKNEVCSMLSNFPKFKIQKFVLNFRQTFLFLNEIEMKPGEIGRIVRSYPIILGSCALKKISSLLINLNTGKKRLRDIILNDPQELKKFVYGSKVKKIPNSDEVAISRQEKVKFLLNIGFVEDSKEMKKALNVFRGKGDELKERFECFVKTGLEFKDVCEIVKKFPHILNQSKDMTEMKINFLVNNLGFPVSTLKTFPSYVSYTIERVKLRTSMYNWLKENGKLGRNELALSTVLACPDTYFEKTYVNQHPCGPQVWQDLKKQICLK